MESYALETVRVCEFVEVKRFDTGKECVLAKLDPPVDGYSFGLNFDVSEVVLAARHEGDGLSPIRRFPCFVHVARPLGDIRGQVVVSASDLQNLAWGELYRSRGDAESHVLESG